MLILFQWMWYSAALEVRLGKQKTLEYLGSLGASGIGGWTGRG